MVRKKMVAMEKVSSVQILTILKVEPAPMMGQGLEDRGLE